MTKALFECEPSPETLIAYVEQHPDVVPWLEACAFMRAAYGAKACSIIITSDTDDEYDDEHYYHGDAYTIEIGRAHV